MSTTLLRSEDESNAILRNARGGKKDATPVLERVSATGTLRALMLEMNIEQHYRNDSRQNIEAVYTFPLAHGAVLLGLDVELNGKLLSGVAVERQQAEHDYEEAIASGNSAIMLEKSGAGLYTVNLGNLLPGEKAVIRYRYVQPLAFVQGNLRVVLPTVIAPRYGDAEKQGGMRAGAVPTTNLLASYPFTMTLDIEAPLSRCRVSSPSHSLVLQQREGGSLRITLAQDGWLDRDLVVNIDGVDMGSTLVLAHDKTDAGTIVAMASLCPPLPPESAGLRAPLALKILVDCSGSMGGDSITAAKRALHRILAVLKPGDSVTYTRFGSTTIHDVKLPLLIDADGNSLKQLARCVANTEAGLGGTETRRAMNEVFALGDREAAAVLLITDGETWNADEIIAAAKSAGQRVFAVGIGAAPAESLLRKLGNATGGACEFVAPEEDVEGAVLRLFGRLRAPRVRDVRIVWPQQPEIAGDVPKSLFEGETLHLFATFGSLPSGDAVLSWRTDNDSTPHELRVAMTGTVHQEDTLARLFAAQRIAARDLQKDSAGATALAVQYQLVSEHTNYLVVHERAANEKAQDLPALRQVDQMLAAGWGGTGGVRLQGCRKDSLSVCRSTVSASFDSPMAPSACRDFEDDIFGAGPSMTLSGAPRPADLLAELWALSQTAAGLPQDLQSLHKWLPETLYATLCAIALQKGEDEALALFYAALLALVRSGAGERQLQRHLLKLAKPVTADELVQAGLGGITAGSWR